MAEAKQLSDSMLLQTASGGRALQGILLTKHFQDQLQARSCLLEAPKNVVMSDASSFHDEKDMHFYSAREEKTYKKSVEVLGYSIAAADAPVNVYGDVSIGASESTGHKTMARKQQLYETYCSVVKQFIVEVASCLVMDKDMKLSAEARDELIIISRMIQSQGKECDRVYKACESFLHKYGSHVNRGPIKFGGISFWTCSSNDFSQEEAITLKKMQDSAISATTGVTISATEMNIDAIKKSYQGKCTKRALDNTHLYVKIHGGPEAGKLEQWSKGLSLVANNSTWIVIDRGSKLIAVWDIIKKSHEKELGGVGSVLRDVWEKMTGLKAELQSEAHFDAEEILHEISQWHIEDMSCQEIESKLDYLLKTKNGNSSIWISEYLSKPPLQQFLKSIMDKYMHQEPSEFGCTKLLAMQLAQEEELATFNALTFPCIDQLTQWLYPVYHVEPLQELTVSRPKPVVREPIEGSRPKLKPTVGPKSKCMVQDPTVGPSPKQRTKTLNQEPTLEPRPIKPNQEPTVGPRLFQEPTPLGPGLKLSVQEPTVGPSPKPSIQRPTVASKPKPGVHKTGNGQNGAYHGSCSNEISLDSSSAHALVEKLGLSKYYPKKLHLLDALCVTSEKLDLSIGRIELTEPKKLPFLVLHKIMSYDSLCRSALMQMEPSLSSSLSSSSSSSSLSSLSSEEDISDSNSTGINPVDCILALILCSNDFLRQDIISRLAKCQLSVPLVIPDPFSKQLTIPLWAMRSIIKEWKCSSRIVEQTLPIVSSEMPIVSFIRLTKQKKHSKSGLLNEVISIETSHFDHFLHFQCRGGQHKLVLGDGLVDMCWYLPSGKPGDKFPDAVTFLNLHGDARDHPQQTNFLSEISTMCFVFITREDVKKDNSGRTLEVLKKLSSCPCGFIMLSKDYSSSSLKKLAKKVSNSCLLPLTDHVPDTAKGIVDQIKKNLSKTKTFKSIECAVKDEGKNHEFLVDEEDGKSKQGLCLAEEVEVNITSDVVEDMLPLQGSAMWKKWASKNREIHRQKQREGQTLQYSIAGIQTEMEQIRRKQFSHIKQLSSLMECFVNLLLQLQGHSNKYLRNYFLQSLKLDLNKRSMERMSELGHKYKSVKNKLKTVDKQANEGLVKELKKLEMDIVELSFGLEHFLREVGQIYEATAALPSESYGHDFLSLPKAVAELLIDGWPLEVMDGDAAHVPLTWVSAVLKEAAKILNDPKVFVLSVVGLQSTGKSTMLNTVFGLQFNVSAGRCTRGAFMQLLPLDEELSRETKCSYVLVVDTEGLRAPTTDASVIHEHDNMLATFVIGLADMTFINIMGETPGDMNDILQTSVHAFVRMKLATQKFSPSCQFIHQNTGKNVQKEVGDSQITAKLDDCTLLAAEQEQCVGEYKHFKDVIQFDSQTDIHHFPGLLKGGPPMAPIAEDYSSAAQKLKQHFIKYLLNKAKNPSEGSSSGCGIKFSLLHTKISDLWDSLLEENFVFSFKNTMEIVAYKTLETEWSRSWRWPFCEKMLTWEKNAENIITAADSVQSVCDVVETKRSELAHLVNETKSEIQGKMKTYFDKKQNDQLEPWRGTFQLRLEILSSDLKVHAESHIVEIGDNRKPIFGYGKDQEKFMKIVRQGVANRIVRIKNSGVQLGPQPETVLKAEFDALWEGLMQDIPSTTGKIGNIEAEVQAKLLDFKGDYRDRMRRILVDKPLTQRGQNLKMNPKVQKHFKFVGRIKKLSTKVFNPSPADLETVNNVTSRIFNAAREHLEKKRAEKHNFHPGLIVDLLHLVDDMIDQESKEIEENIIFTSEYRIDVFWTVCSYAVPVFHKMAVSFKERTDPRIHLETNVKHVLLRQFIDQCRQVEAEEAIANALCASLEKPIIDQIRINNMGVIMVRKLKASESHCFSDKSALKAKILTDIRTEDNFEGYMEFVRNVKWCFEKRIKAYVIEFSNEIPKSSSRTRLQQEANKEVSRLIELIQDKVDGVKETNIKEWLSVFCEDKTLKEELGLTIKVGDLLEGYKSSHKLNLDSFSQRVRDGLHNLMQNLHETFKDIECRTEMENWRDKPHKHLKELIGCTAQCPFCKEQCDIGHEHGSETKHRTAVHRPSNLASWRNSQTQVMVVDFCPALVASDRTFKCKETNDKPHPYEKYQKIYDDWTIPASVTSQDSLYWMWFAAKYNDDIARYYDAKPASVPPQWLDVTEETLKKHLEGVYHL